MGTSVTLQRIADAVAAMKNAQVHFTVTNATPARANDVGFSPTLHSVKLGHLVPANSAIQKHRGDRSPRGPDRRHQFRGSTSDVAPAVLATAVRAAP